MGFLDRSREQRAQRRQAMEREVNSHLDRAVQEADVGNIEAEEEAIHAAFNASVGYDGLTKSASRFLNERLRQMVAAGAIRRSEFLGFAGDVHMWQDRIVMYDQGFEVQRMDGKVHASVETAGELIRSQRPTLTRMMVGSVLPGSALIPGLAFQKQTVQDTRALFFVLEHPKWGRMIQLSPEYEAALRQVAHAVNQTALRLGHQTAEEADAGNRRDSTLSALKQLGELHDAGVLTDAEFETKKAKLLEEL
jgi:Short C-terminal domain